MQKGRRLEQLVAQLFVDMGWKARRQPGSGRFDGFPHDVSAVHPEHGTHIIECKARKDAPKTLERWLGQGDILVVRADRDEPVVYMRWRTFKGLVGVDHE